MPKKYNVCLFCGGKVQGRTYNKSSSYCSNCVMTHTKLSKQKYLKEYYFIKKFIVLNYLFFLIETEIKPKDEVEKNEFGKITYRFTATL